MSLRLNADRRCRRIVREDRKHLEAGARSFLSDYLRATKAEKELYYDAVSSAAARCRPSNAVSHLDSKQMADETADVASRVARQRQRSARHGAVVALLAKSLAEEEWFLGRGGSRLNDHRRRAIASGAALMSRMGA